MIFNVSEPLRETVPNFIFGSPDRCTYCGESPSAIDHVIPISQYTTANRRRGGAGKEKGVRTHACAQCNGILGDKYFPTFLERVLHVRGALTKKAAKFKTKASWTDEEIAELSESLRGFIASKQFQVREWDRRTEWALSRRFYETIENLDDCHPLQKDHPKFCQWVHDYFASILV